MSANAVTGRLARCLVPAEWVVLFFSYALLLISDGVPLIMWGLIALVWLARLATGGAMKGRTALDVPIVLLLVLSLNSLTISTEFGRSEPKFYGLVLGFAFYYAVIYYASDRTHWGTLVFWLVAACGLIALAGLVGTDWAQGRIAALGPIYERLPRVIQGIPRSIAGGFSRNGVGGTLTLTIPLLASLWLVRAEWAAEFKPRVAVWYPRILSVALLLSLITLGLTLSRGALLGTAIGLGALGFLQDRRLGWLVAAGGIGLAVLWVAGYGPAIANALFRLDAGNGTLASRLEVWERGVLMVQDFPWTGIGMGTYNEVAHSLYPFFIAAPDEVVAHAHNTLLQVAVDLGIPGLIAFTAILAGFAVSVVRVYRFEPTSGVRMLVAGLGVGMLAHQVFGLTDAFMLGTKPGILLWVYFALAISIGMRLRNGPPEPQPIRGTS